MFTFYIAHRKNRKHWHIFGHFSYFKHYYVIQKKNFCLEIVAITSNCSVYRKCIKLQAVPCLSLLLAAKCCSICIRFMSHTLNFSFRSISFNIVCYLVAECSVFDSSLLLSQCPDCSIDYIWYIHKGVYYYD